jgi:DNA-binding CsgD family transcriptional regulator
MILKPVEATRTVRLLAEASLRAEPALVIRAPERWQPRRACLIGREQELAVLTALVDHAPDTGSALLIRGGPGAGKSALVGALVAELQDRPVAVLGASGIRAEANLPYAGLHQLLRPVLGEVGLLPRPQRRAIEAAFGIAVSPEPDPFLIALATLGLLSMAARQSLFVVVEDAQWLDRRTSEVLSFVARRLSSDRIVLLVTTRDDRRCPILDAGLAELHLERLGDDESRRLLATVAPDTAEPVREWLIDTAAGNPLALVELPVALTSEQRTGRAPLPDTIPLTARLERAVAGRMRELPVVTRRLLRLLALDDGADVADLLAAYAALHPDEPAARDALKPAVAAGVVMVHEQTATFRDHLLRAAVRQGISVAGRRSADLALDAASADGERTIRHLVASPDAPDARVAAMERAAERGYARGAIDPSIDLSDLAAHDAVCASPSASRPVRPAALAQGPSRRDVAERSPNVVEAELLDDLGRAPLQLLREPWVTEIADGAVTTDLVRLAESALDEGDDVLARRLLWTAAQQAMWGTGEDDGMNAIRGAAARLGPPVDDPWLLAISAAVGSSDAASISEAAARYERPDAAPTDLLLAGMASAIAGDVVRSRSLLARAAPVLRGEGDRRPLAPMLVMQAWNDIQLGRWTEAASEIEAGAELARETRQVTWSVVADVADALLAAMRGDEDQVERALARVGHAAIGRGNGWVASTVEVVRGINELSAGRPELAFTRLHGRIGSSAPEAPWAIDHFADAAMVSGRVDEGRAVLEASGGEVDASRGPLHVAAHVYAGAVLADEDTADERQRLAIDDLVTWPIHQARLQLHRGRWLRRHRRVADSRPPLRAALDLFVALGAAPLAEQARRELRASGERIRRRDVTAWDQLSPQETEIAHMAADGLSNREIGEQLFLSHRTVGAHLYRIFPKLGVTSRGQLHKVLATTDPDRVVDIRPLM